jgi:hypothetical protein
MHINLDFVHCLTQQALGWRLAIAVIQIEESEHYSLVGGGITVLLVEVPRIAAAGQKSVRITSDMMDGCKSGVAVGRPV